MSNSFNRYVLGHEAMRKMINSNVLIIGLGGLGVEIGIRRTATPLFLLTYIL